uniref:SERPIN domain-containing protein n=1 Tax=Caenorhabditis tropicalis TaxID=1561998 RepID=A0A1I7V291_9PELO
MSISVLINAIYFKGYWLNKFPKRHTYDSEFTSYSGEKTMKTFMSEYGFCGDSSSDDIFHVIHLNYVDERFELSIFLPKERNTLKEALNKLDSLRFMNLMQKRTVKMLHVSLLLKPSLILSFQISVPKFRIDTSVDPLKSNLQNLEITEIFSESADLSGITNNLWVSDGVHKAMIETDEDGTVAAAVTLEYFNEMDGEVDPTYFTADHPFLFALTFENHPLFLGVLNQ